MSTQVNPRRLPVGDMIGQSFKITWHSRNLILSRVAIFLVGIAIVGGLCAWALYPEMQKIIYSIRYHDDSLTHQEFAILISAFLIFYVVAILLFSSMNVAWTRYVLLKEEFRLFYFKAAFWFYLKRLVLLILMVMGIALAFIAVFGLIEFGAHYSPNKIVEKLLQVLGFFVLLGLYVYMIVWFLGKQLVLPAAAIEDRTMTFKRSRQIMHGNKFLSLVIQIAVFMFAWVGLCGLVLAMEFLTAGIVLGAGFLLPGDKELLTYLAVAVGVLMGVVMIVAMIGLLFLVCTLRALIYDYLVLKAPRLTDLDTVS